MLNSWIPRGFREVLPTWEFTFPHALAELLFLCKSISNHRTLAVLCFCVCHRVLTCGVSPVFEQINCEVHRLFHSVVWFWSVSITLRRESYVSSRVISGHPYRFCLCQVSYLNTVSPHFFFFFPVQAMCVCQSKDKSHSSVMCVLIS